MDYGILLATKQNKNKTHQQCSTKIMLDISDVFESYRGDFLGYVWSRNPNFGEFSNWIGTQCLSLHGPETFKHSLSVLNGVKSVKPMLCPNSILQLCIVCILIFVVYIFPVRNQHTLYTNIKLYNVSPQSNCSFIMPLPFTLFMTQ